MAGTRDDLHDKYLEAMSKLDHFLLAGLAAICAFLAQSNPYGPLGLNPNTLFLISLLTISLAAIASHLRITYTVQFLKVNTQFLEFSASDDWVNKLACQQAMTDLGKKTNLFSKVRSRVMYLGFLLYIAAKVWTVYYIE